MSNMPELKIGVVAVSRDCFPESLSVNRRKALIDAYTKKYGEGTVYEFIGMSMDSTREDMTQAVLEGVAFGLRDSLEVARSIGVNPERTKICGGGAKSPLWRKIIANVMNMKVDLIESEEGPGYGAAILAAVGCGVFDSVEEAAKKLVKVTGTEEPDPELVQKYEERYQEFKKLYPALKGIYQGKQA